MIYNMFFISHFVTLTPLLFDFELPAMNNSEHDVQGQHR